MGQKERERDDETRGLPSLAKRPSSAGKRPCSFGRVSSLDISLLFFVPFWSREDFFVCSYPTCFGFCILGQTHTLFDVDRDMGIAGHATVRDPEFPELFWMKWVGFYLNAG
jgi:hypothetical protein